jgi:hypothetical protein
MEGHLSDDISNMTVRELLMLLTTAMQTHGPDADLGQLPMAALMMQQQQQHSQSQHSDE